MLDLIYKCYGCGQTRVWGRTTVRCDPAPHAYLLCESYPQCKSDKGVGDHVLHTFVNFSARFLAGEV